MINDADRTANIDTNRESTLASKSMYGIADKLQINNLNEQTV